MSACTATVTSKGQMTVPAEIRKAWNLQAGDQVEFVTAPDGRVFVRPLNLPASALFGFLAHLKPDPNYRSDDDAIADQIIAEDEATMSGRGKSRAG